MHYLQILILYIIGSGISLTIITVICNNKTKMHGGTVTGKDCQRYISITMHTSSEYTAINTRKWLYCKTISTNRMETMPKIVLFTKLRLLVKMLEKSAWSPFKKWYGLLRGLNLVPRQNFGIFVAQYFLILTCY